MSIVPAAVETSENLQETPWAFISFVPEDLPWCDWLYFTLHGYPVPAALAVHATKYGFPLPERLSAFPDPNDPAHLDHLAEAVGCARYLIVVVSPHSAHSAQIDEHIRTFKRSAGEERIIALVVEGQPVSSSTLYVRSDNREWLPRWLQWRLEENGHFKPAGATEPLIIDARPGYANLDDVMTSLLAVLLDVPREELELLEALTPAGGAFAEASAGFAREEIAAAAMDAVEQGTATGVTDRSSGERRQVSRGGVVALLAVMLALCLAGVVLIPGDQGTEMQVSVADVGAGAVSTPSQADASVVDLDSLSDGIPPLPEVAFTPVAPEQKMESRETPVALEDEPSGPPAVPQSDPLPPAAPEVSGSESQGEREIAVRLEKEALLMRAEELMRRGELEEAMKVYERALDAVQRFASLPTSRPAAKLEVARICRTLGALQMRFASSMEARQTYERGRKAIQKLKLSNGDAKERTALLSDLQAGLRRVAREIE